MDTTYYSKLLNESDLDILYTTRKFNEHDFKITKKFYKNVYFDSISMLFDELITRGIKLNDFILIEVLKTEN